MENITLLVHKRQLAICNEWSLMLHCKVKYPDQFYSLYSVYCQILSFIFSSSDLCPFKIKPFLLFDGLVLLHSFTNVETNLIIKVSPYSTYLACSQLPTIIHWPWYCTVHVCVNGLFEWKPICAVLLLFGYILYWFGRVVTISHVKVNIVKYKLSTAQ